MYRIITFLVACLLRGGRGRRTQSLALHLHEILLAPSSSAYFGVNQTSGSATANAGWNEIRNLWQDEEVQRVLMLLCLIAIGKALQGRFPNAEPNAIQKLLLQFLVPATLFKGLSKTKMELGHLSYLGGGFLFVLARAATSVLVSSAVLGCSSQERAKLQRTAIFEISTTASGLSVLPFIGEFLNRECPECVGLGGMVDIPMKLYMLLIMPVLLKKFGGDTSDSANHSQGAKSKVTGVLTQLFTDPITMSLVLGVLAAAATGGGGTAKMGFVGVAIEKLSLAQTPVLFLLIGLKLKFESSTPLFCVVLLLATQGVLLIIVWVALLIVNPQEDSLARFTILFVQGAPSVVGMGVISAAVDSGVDGYSKDFAFDIVGMAFPISSFMQCFAGIMGSSYQSVLPLIASILIVIAVGLRVGFSNHFEEEQ